MLTITIPGNEVYDEVNNLFIKQKACTITLEHSLVSLSKWESKWKKPFLKKDPERSTQQTIDYIRCMTITQNVPDSTYTRLSDDNIKDIMAYINDEQTATTINNGDKKINKQTVTAEIIYYWMIALNIPSEYQKWHLNRLLTLINVCNIKNKPPKKSNKRDLISRNARLNEERRRALNSKG